MTESQLIKAVLSDDACIKCSRHSVCRAWLHSAIVDHRKEIYKVCKDDGDYIRINFECGRWKMISKMLLEEVE